MSNSEYRHILDVKPLNITSSNELYSNMLDRASKEEKYEKIVTSSFAYYLNSKNLRNVTQRLVNGEDKSSILLKMSDLAVNRKTNEIIKNRYTSLEQIIDTHLNIKGY